MDTGLDATKYTHTASKDAYKAFYDEQGNHYGNHHLDENFPRAKFILDRVKPTDYVMEMGCQTGGITRLVAPKVYMVIANELSDSYRNRAEEVLRDIHNLDIVSGFAEDLGTMLFFQEVFNVVIAMELLEHVADPAKICESAHACLRDGGLALFSVPKGYTDALGEHVREFTEESFRALLIGYFRDISIFDEGEWFLAEAYK